MPVQLTCMQCSREFSVPPSGAQKRKHCSRRCHGDSMKGKFDRVPVECATCGEVFKVPRHRRDTARYCSRQCKWSDTNEETLTCDGCGSEFTVDRGRADEAKYCGWDCYQSNRYGERSANWKGGPQPLECARCGGGFEVRPSAAKWRKYCSMRCSHLDIRPGPTSIEVAVADELARRGIVYEEQVKIGRRFTADFFLRQFDLVVECDGDYWHSRPEAGGRDARKDRHIRSQGYEVVRLSESEINENVTAAVDRALAHVAALAS